LNILIGS
jgi:hypothetical protein